jgi:RNA polymerase sigma factor (sigma-70 family)
MPADLVDSIDNHEAAFATVGCLVDTDDIALVADAKTGSSHAFEVLVERHARRILRVAQRVTGNREDAEDIAQQTFQKAFVHLQTFEGKSSFSTWLTRIAINEALMGLRRKRWASTVSIDEVTPRGGAVLARQVPDLGPSPERSYSQQERERILSFAMNQLTPGIRAAIQLCKLDELSLKESAQIMGVSIEATKSRVHLGRRRLREALKRYFSPTSRVRAKKNGGFSPSGRVISLVLLAVCCIVASASAQNTGVIGSVPSGPASDDVLRLTLQDAINMALRYNLGAIERGENAQFARGQRLIALSNLLPQVSAGASENVAQTSLATLGIKNLPGIPSVLGPYSYSTVDASLSQTLFNFESIQNFRAARTTEQAAQLSYKDALDVVTLTVGNAYLQVIETSSRIEAQQAQVRNARALHDQANEEYQAGTNSRIDATRTEVQLVTEEYNLSVARNNFAIAKLTLARAIGLPLGQEFDIVDQLPYSDINPPTVEDALKAAYSSRSDFRAALASQKAGQETLSAAKGERYPVVTVNGDYGDVGTTFDHSHGNFSVQAGVRIPIFAGGRIKGDVTQAEAALRQRQAEAENTRGLVDYDVRTAFLNLSAAKEQVDVAQRNVALANENLARSKDRFTSGVTDSVEVVQSEQSLEAAADQYITSVYNHNLAKLMLARSLGVARTKYKQYIGGD